MPWRASDIADTPLVAEGGKLSTEILRAIVRYQGIWYSTLSKDFLEVVDYSS